MSNGEAGVVGMKVERSVPWYKEINRQQWQVLIAASLGYGLEAMDMMLYALVILQVMKELNITSATGGILASISLFSAAFGGIAFGLLADKIGRTKSLMASILIYSVFTTACGFSQNILQLGIFRFLLGIGLGGEWTAGAALIAESWPAKHRGKAMGLVQANFGVGYALAAIVTMIVLPHFGWRFVFFVGALPALLTYFVRRKVQEPEIWEKNSSVAAHLPSRSTAQLLGDLFRGNQAWRTIVATLVCSCCLSAYWGAFTWIPGYLSMPVAKGGAGLNIFKSLSWILIMQIGGICGHLTFGAISDQVGRKSTTIVFLIMSAVLTVIYGFTHDPTTLLLLGPFLAYFGYGYYASFGAILSEIYPTTIRATGTGFCYNVGRGVSSFAPALVGALALRYGMGAGLAATAIAYVLGSFFVFLLPETRGKVLD